MYALLKAGMDSGEVAPLPRTIFGREQCQDAFRFLASGAGGAAYLFKSFIVIGKMPTGWACADSPRCRRHARGQGAGAVRRV